MKDSEETSGRRPHSIMKPWALAYVDSGVCQGWHASQAF